jgi:hypothetical protein
MEMLKQIDVSDLPEPMVEAIVTIVQAYRKQAVSAPLPKKRTIGWLRGQLQVPDSFFDPLPDDLLNLFEGKPEKPE